VGSGSGLEFCGLSRHTGIRSTDLPAHSESLYLLRCFGSMYIYITVNYSLLSLVLTDDKFTMVLASWLIVSHMTPSNLFVSLFLFYSPV
jgi:hypothetical protein